MHIVPIYHGVPQGFDWTDVTQLRRKKTDPEPGTPVCVAFTTAKYQALNAKTGDPSRISFNVQWVTVLS